MSDLLPNLLNIVHSTIVCQSQTSHKTTLGQENSQMKNICTLKKYVCKKYLFTEKKFS